MIGALASLRDAYDQLAEVAVRRLLSLQALRRGGEAWERQVHQLLEKVEPRHVSHVQLNRIRRHGLPLPTALSFHTIMVQQFEARNINTADSTWKLDRKLTGYAFADRAGVRRPKCDLTVRRFEEIEPAAPLVVKPAFSTGARGVYLCTSLDRIIHLQDVTQLGSWDEMVGHARSLMDDGYRPLPDRWFTEELIMESPGVPARDLKFFAFYGEIQLVLEVVRYPKVRAQFWRPDREPVKVGYYDDKTLVDSLGVTREQVAEAVGISRQIPRPFMRIDMLAGADGLVLGEFTPRPAGFDQLTPAWDRNLGEAWMRAEGQLLADLLDGKRFDAFLASTR